MPLVQISTFPSSPHSLVKMSSDLEKELIKHRNRLAALLFNPNDIERGRREVDPETGRWDGYARPKIDWVEPPEPPQRRTSSTSQQTSNFGNSFIGPWPADAAIPNNEDVALSLVRLGYGGPPPWTPSPPERQHHQPLSPERQRMASTTTISVHGESSCEDITEFHSVALRRRSSSETLVPDAQHGQLPKSDAVTKDYEMTEDDQATEDYDIAEDDKVTKFGDRQTLPRHLPIPAQIMALRDLILSLPIGKDGYPTRHRMRTEPGLEGEVSKNNGVLRQSRTGGRLREYAGDRRLFSQQWWAYLLNE